MIFVQLISIKVIRNKQTGQSEGYGFVEFCSHDIAEKVLQTFNGQQMPNSEHPFRLNWASFSMGDRRSDFASDYSIFVGDLAPDVSDTMLQEIFASKYPSVKGAKVVIDANTGRSKGYGFVRFGNDDERTDAMTEMNGAYCSSRPMRIGAATPRKSIVLLHLPRYERCPLLMIFLRPADPTTVSTAHPMENYISLHWLSPELRQFPTSLSSISTPNSVQEALQYPRWQTVMDEKMSALWANQTWDLVPLPFGQTCVGCKWVFAIKHVLDETIQHLKALLAARGFTKQQGLDYDETSPIAKLNSVRVLISLDVYRH
ncbi:Polyadenylate-binding protein RBP47 [Platanthera zijinensis]|uniref:Polyadenylate-binding protein RBP47 n=1 Tax=Platanthera zijinensis TaxID=2320716 RepID=A0AAP0BVY9_9ASPA